MDAAVERASQVVKQRLKKEYDISVILVHRQEIILIPLNKLISE